MNTAVSIPDELAEKMDRLAQNVGRSRSELVREALQDYLARHDAGEVTEAMNRAVDVIDPPADGFIAEATRRVIGRTEW